MALAFAINVLVVAQCVMDREDRDMDSAARAVLASEGRTFIALERGFVHYELASPSDAHTIVLIHGTSGPMTVWDETVVYGLARG